MKRRLQLSLSRIAPAQSFEIFFLRALVVSARACLRLLSAVFCSFFWRFGVPAPSSATA